MVSLCRRSLGSAGPLALGSVLALLPKVPVPPGTTIESLVKDLPGQLAGMGLQDVTVEQVTLASFTLVH